VLFNVPLSEQEARFKWLQEQVVLYRLALGHTNQEDLLEVLRNHAVTEELVRNSSLELSAYFARDLQLRRQPDRVSSLTCAI
jgi:hypothetical protein